MHATILSGNNLQCHLWMSFGTASALRLVGQLDSLSGHIPGGVAVNLTPRISHVLDIPVQLRFCSKSWYGLTSPNLHSASGAYLSLKPHIQYVDLVQEA